MFCGHAGGILLAAMENAELISVSCNHCGAPLPVAESTRFITCTFCGSNLEVHRQGSVSAYTEVLHNIDQRTKKIEQDLHDLKRQSDLEQLDRAWMMRRDQLLVSGRRGSRTVPSMATGFIGMIFAVVFMLFWTAMAISHNAPFVFPSVRTDRNPVSRFTAASRRSQKPSNTCAKETSLVLQQLPCHRIAKFRIRIIALHLPGRAF